MNIRSLHSDQLITWSAIHARYSVVRSTQTSREVAAANAAVGYLVARFAHRALQALWQTWLQVCRWPRAWSKALLVGELSRLPAADGLRATSQSGRCRQAPRKLPPRPRDHRRDLRDQPRTTTPPRGV